MLIKLPKKGDLSHCKNWVGIIVLNMASKVFCRVILEPIKAALDCWMENCESSKRVFKSKLYRPNSDAQDSCGTKN